MDLEAWELDQGLEQVLASLEIAKLNGHAECVLALNKYFSFLVFSLHSCPWSTWVVSCHT